jgi:hypothetical protein
MKYFLIIGFLLGGFTLTLAQENVETSEVIASAFNPADLECPDPLYVRSVRGSAKIITKEEFEKIGSGEIAYVSILNDERSTYIYGDKAKNGVVLIVMKDNSLSEKFSTRKRRNR